MHIYNDFVNEFVILHSYHGVKIFVTGHVDAFLVLHNDGRSHTFFRAFPKYSIVRVASLKK